MQLVVHADGRAILGSRIMRAAIGRAGVRVHKEEGDGATPAGPLPLRRVLYRADRVTLPRCVVPREPIGPQDGWCDESGHRDYNRPVALPHSAHHEELWRRDGLYDVVGVLGWNDAPVVRARGSAIFLHVASDDLRPTEGCVALPLSDLLAVLAVGLTEVLVVG
jgi:L,D-peptidoglycan transpeptidase YkuD (ErfK/YbiS/YcfS/YnhG family)